MFGMRGSWTSKSGFLETMGVGSNMTIKKINIVAKFHVMEGTFFEGIYTLVH